MTITLKCPECDNEMEWDVIPGHASANVQDHNHPLFGDDGAALEIEKGSLECQCGHTFDPETIFEEIEGQDSGPDDERDPE